MLRTFDLLLCFILIGFITLRWGDAVKKNSKYIYIIFSLFVMLSVVFVYFIDIELHTWYVTPLRVIYQSTIGAVLFSFVMLASTFPTKNIRFKMMKLRTEWSILGFLFSLPQALEYTILAYKGLIEGKGNIVYVMITTIITVLLLVLGITSFSFFKKKLGHRRWLKIQKWSYLFYFLLFLELILIALVRTIVSIDSTLIEFVPSMIRLIIYLTVYCSNIIFRIRLKRAKSTSL